MLTRSGTDNSNVWHSFPMQTNMKIIFIHSILVLHNVRLNCVKYARYKGVCVRQCKCFSNVTLEQLANYLFLRGLEF